MGIFSSLCLEQVRKIGCDDVTSHQIWFLFVSVRLEDACPLGNRQIYRTFLQLGVQITAKVTQVCGGHVRCHYQSYLMKNICSCRSTPTGEKVTLSGGEERRRVCSASHVSDGTPLFLLLPLQRVPEQWHCWLNQPLCELVLSNHGTQINSRLQTESKCETC